MTTVERAKRSLGRRTILAMAVSAIGLAAAAQAQGAIAAELVDLQVINRDTGQSARVWRRDGRLFVAGQPGARYSLRVTNHSGGRVLVVMSVDGVNILTGETAGYDQRGYVFGPYQSYDVSGWRKSDSEVAAFTFAPLPQSYAARTGRPGDVGVIGIAAFRERVAVPIAVAPAYEPERARRSDARAPGAATARRLDTPSAPPPPVPAARMAPSAGLAAPAPPADASEVVVTAQRREEKLGTAHGAREWSVTTVVPFERASRYPQLVRRIEYDTYDNLVASGVIPIPRDVGRRPQPFPSNPGGGGYVPDPPYER